MAPSTRSRFIILTTLGYGVFAALWIFLTDRVIALFSDLAAAAWFSTLKGMVFVLVTTAALYFGLQAVPESVRTSGERRGILRPAGDRRDLLGWPTWVAYGFAAVITVAVVLFRASISTSVADRPLLILFILPIVLSALWGGLGPGLLATGMAALGDAWVVRPYDTLTMGDPLDRFQLALLLASGLLISITSEALHRSRREAVAGFDALRGSERRYRELFDANPHPMWVYDLDSMAFLAVNDSAVAKYGYSRDEFLGMTLREIRSPEDVSALPDNVAHTDGAVRATGPWRHRLKDGTEILVEISSHPLMFEGRRGRLVLASDITAREAAEREVRRLNADLELRVRQRTAQLDAANRELAYTVSHDLKAPLRGIDGYSRLLEDDHAGRLGTEGVTFVGNIRRGVAQLQELIDDLLAYSRMERRTLQMATIDAGAVVERVVRERQDDMERRGVHLQRSLPVDSMVRADAEGLSLALRNLLDNALKFTRDATPPEIEIGAETDGEHCVIWVRDNGIGFDMKFHDRLFEIFQRLQRAEDYSGTGIGLTIVRKAMQRMGGRAWARSEPGRGATFFLELPR